MPQRPPKAELIRAVARLTANPDVLNPADEHALPYLAWQHEHRFRHNLTVGIATRIATSAATLLVCYWLGVVLYGVLGVAVTAIAYGGGVRRGMKSHRAIVKWSAQARQRGMSPRG